MLGKLCSFENLSCFIFNKIFSEFRGASLLPQSRFLVFRRLLSSEKNCPAFLITTLAEGRKSARTATFALEDQGNFTTAEQDLNRPLVCDVTCSKEANDWTIAVLSALKLDKIVQYLPIVSTERVCWLERGAIPS